VTFADAPKKPYKACETKATQDKPRCKVQKHLLLFYQTNKPLQQLQSNKPQKPSQNTQTTKKTTRQKQLHTKNPQQQNF
jgi:hypothetical protein